VVSYDHLVPMIKNAFGDEWGERGLVGDVSPAVLWVAVVVVVIGVLAGQADVSEKAGGVGAEVGWSDSTGVVAAGSACPMVYFVGHFESGFAVVVAVSRQR